MANTNQNTTPVDKGFVKLSEMIANPLVKVYKAGQLALVFIFVGLLLIVFAQINSTSKYGTASFVLGATLIFLSFLLFLVLQIKNPLTKQRNIDKGKEVIDNLQQLSICLVTLTGRLQTLSFKYINDINGFISIGLPYLQKIPLIPEKVKNYGVKVQDIQNSVVDFVQKSETVIQEAEEALITSDIKKFQEYAKRIQNLNQQINAYLKK